jgi:hypothetical protein
MFPEEHIVMTASLYGCVMTDKLWQTNVIDLTGLESGSVPSVPEFQLGERSVYPLGFYECLIWHNNDYRHKQGHQRHPYFHLSADTPSLNYKNRCKKKPDH